jgi:hypothetical protein
VVLVVAKKVFFDSQEQNKLVDNSGLTAVFRTGTHIGYGELEDCYRAGHRLSTIFTNLHSIAQFVGEQERQRGAAFAFRMMQHSLGNTKERLRIIAPEAEAYYALDEVMLDACVAYGDQILPANGLRWPKTGQLVSKNETPFPLRELKAVFSPSESKLILNAHGAEGHLLDPRFAAIIIELSRNLSKHSQTSGTGTITIKSEPRGFISVLVEGQASPAEAYKLCARLILPIDKEQKHLRGVPTIKLLAIALAGAKAKLDCFFASAEKTVCATQKKELQEAKLDIHIAGPRFVFENMIPPDCTLHFQLKLSGLKAILTPKK